MDWAVIATVAVLALGTVLNVTNLDDRPFVPGFDLALDALAGIVTAAVAVLGWSRYRELGDPVGLFIAAASVVLLIADKATFDQLLDQLGATLLADAKLQAPFYVSWLAQFLVVGLLIVGTVTAVARRTIQLPLFILFAPAFVLLGLFLLLPVLEPILPPLVSGLRAGSTPPEGLALSTPLGVFLHMSNAALFVLAAVIARRLYRRRGWAADGSVVVAAVIAAFFEANTAFVPIISPDQITTIDLLLLAFELALFFGLAADARAALRGRRRRNAMLERRRGDDVARGGLEERSRLSRELHDGLAQDLWLAKLKVGRLLSLPDAPPEAIAISQELGIAIDAGLAVARQAVLALRAPGEGSFPEVLTQYVDDFSDAFGLPTQVTCEGDLPALGPATQAELMRIAQESLMNARRHADATLIRVVLRSDEHQLHLAIIDNGRGFQMDQTRRKAFGLGSMRERAALIGGRLTIESQPQGGTSVVLDLPLGTATARRRDVES